MIVFKTGDLLESNCHAIVNTVNCVGVMGKGLALQFKQKFPDNYTHYRKYCLDGHLRPGKVYAYLTDNNQYIFNVATKDTWHKPSKYEWVAVGLTELKDFCKWYKIGSIAIPPLGCGNGGLEWSRVKEMISERFRDALYTVEVYEPT